MTTESGLSPALKPLWSLTLGAAAGSGAAINAVSPGPSWLHLVLVTTGCAALAIGFRFRHRTPIAVWVAAGLLIVGGHGLHLQTRRVALEGLMDRESPTSSRVRLVVNEGWTRGRWGWQTRVGVLEARRKGESTPLPSRCRLEVRGTTGPHELPPPGTVVDALVSLRGAASSPLLVASSVRLLDPTGATRALPTLRNHLAEGLLSSAGTNIRRIRAAELAATLAVGRRDLVPKNRRDGWRRSGLAHVLAVSGLHVGLVGGMTWLILVVLGATPKTTRLTVLMVLPTYALLAGGSPSATRAALMGMVYLGARLAGRALVPMAAVLLTAFVLLLVDPSLVGEISFQLTVLLTAALVRWGPPLAAAIPAPRWPAAVIAIPVVAQLAAAPLVAYHFETAIPGAMLANLAVPFLLGPMVLAAVAATAAAPLWPTAAGWLMEIVGAGGTTLWHCGTPGRAVELVPPTLPTPFLALMIVSGLAALLPGRWARAGTVSYLTAITLFAVWWMVVPPPSRTEIELLPVSHGLAMRVGTPEGQILMDGGGRRREAASLLARTRARRLAAVIASHSDEDHIAGLELVLRTTRTERLILPGWMLQSRDALPLIRTARRHHIEIVPVARGSTVEIGPATLEVLWPPAVAPPKDENERSLVARLRLDEGTILLTSDIGRSTELRLLESGDLGSTILLTGHHGSRNSSSPPFLDAVQPRLALIPAGPENLHHHPHPEVLASLEERGIEYRMPVRDGRCGVRWEDGEWELYP